MGIMPYCLMGEGDSSDIYYSRIKIFSDRIVLEAQNSIYNLLQDYMDFNIDDGLKSFDELVVEVLGLGVMWKVYGGFAYKRNHLLRIASLGVSKIRGKNNSLKPAMEVLKGYLVTFAWKIDNSSLEFPTPKNIDNMLQWLKALGEFDYEIIRLRKWSRFLSIMDKKNARSNIQSIIQFADWFEKEAQELLGVFTSNADRFVQENHKHYKWREDLAACMRRPIEYHYNMAASELLSRAYRNEFKFLKKKMILLPVCMRKKQDEYCKARTEPLGLVCVHCVENCMVNKITRLGKEYGYKVYIIPHESAAFIGKEKSGIIGVSCVTRLIEGGFMARELGFSPQCVILDYCGCKRHWNEKGISTALNIKELEKILKP